MMHQFTGGYTDMVYAMYVERGGIEWADHKIRIHLFCEVGNYDDWF